MNITIGYHARKRLRQRAGIRKKNSSEFIEEVLTNSIKHIDTSGRLKKYLDAIWLNSSDSHKYLTDIRIYHQKVYLFTYKTLVTVLTLPFNLRPRAEKIQKRKNTNNDKNDVNNSDDVNDTNTDTNEDNNIDIENTVIDKLFNF